MKEIKELELLKDFMLQYIKGLEMKYTIHIDFIKPTVKLFDNSLSYAHELEGGKSFLGEYAVINKNKRMGIQWYYFNRMVYTQTNFNKYKENYG